LLELWAELQETADIERIVECYDKEACSFWGTLSEDLRGSEESIRDYFQRFLEGKRFKVVYLERETIVLSPEIVNVSGTYRFENVEDPSMPPISARFTFVIRKRGEGTWRFVTHHSSRMPENGFKLPDGMKR